TKRCEPRLQIPRGSPGRAPRWSSGSVYIGSAKYEFEAGTPVECYLLPAGIPNEGSRLLAREIPRWDRPGEIENDSVIAIAGMGCSSDVRQRRGYATRASGLVLAEERLGGRRWARLDVSLDAGGDHIGDGGVANR